mgnify:CR=1 FL=1
MEQLRDRTAELPPSAMAMMNGTATTSAYQTPVDFQITVFLLPHDRSYKPSGNQNTHQKVWQQYRLRRVLVALGLDLDNGPVLCHKVMDWSWGGRLQCEKDDCFEQWCVSQIAVWGRSPSVGKEVMAWN